MWWIFVDDFDLVAPSKQALKKIFNKVHERAIKNEMNFGINKCASFVVKLINFVKLTNHDDPSFFIGSNKLPKTDKYTYLVFLLMNILIFETYTIQIKQ